MCPSLFYFPEQLVLFLNQTRISLSWQADIGFSVKSPHQESAVALTIVKFTQKK